MSTAVRLFNSKFSLFSSSNWERSRVLSYTFGAVAIEKEAFRSPSTTVANFDFLNANTLKSSIDKNNSSQYKK